MRLLASVSVLLLVASPLFAETRGRRAAASEANGGATTPANPSVPQTSGYINVRDDKMFDSVGKPAQADDESAREYTSEQYDGWVAACEGRKSESMQAFRDCFNEQKRKKIGKTRTDARDRPRRDREYRNVPPRSSLDDLRNPSFDATTDVLVEPEKDDGDSASEKD